jgi:hypothetical protein
MFTTLVAKEKAIAGWRMPIGDAVAGSVIVTGDRNVAIGKSGTIEGRDVVISTQTDKRILSEDQAFERIGTAVRINLDNLQENTAQARSDSSQFFRLSLIFASLGFLVVLAGVALLLAGQVTAGVVSSIASTIPEVTAVLFFRKDRELRCVIERYHQHVLDSQRLLTMIDVAETVKASGERDSLKREIILKALGIEASSQQPAQGDDAKRAAP